MWQVDEVSEVAGKCNGDCSDGTCLVYDERCPSVEKGRQVAVRNTKEHVLASCLRDHSRNLSIRQRAGKRQQSGEDPDEDHDARDLNSRRNALRCKKNAGADHGTDNNHDSRRQP